MNHKIIVDLGFGDAGKGTITDYLAATQWTSVVIRFSGGAQAAHNVVTDDGVHHTFAQFGSGTLSGVPTYLSEFMLFNPLNFMAEARALDPIIFPLDPLQLVTISPDALIITPYHREANRIRERQRGEDRHGSCGQGIGETQSYGRLFPGYAPRVGDMLSLSAMQDKLQRLQGYLTKELGCTDEIFSLVSSCKLAEQFENIAQQIRIDWSGGMLARLLDSGDCVFEGSQGVLLDEWYGFHPYTTWSTTTFENAETLLHRYGHTGTRVGVMRSYTTRHGPGPFPSEKTDGRVPKLFGWDQEMHNGTGKYQGAWRTGNLDMVLMRYAVDVVGGLDEVAVTHMDRIGGLYVDRYLEGPLAVKKQKRDLDAQVELTELLSHVTPAYGFASNPKQFVSVIESRLDAPVSMLSYGPRRGDKRVRDRALVA